MENEVVGSRKTHQILHRLRLYRSNDALYTANRLPPEGILRPATVTPWISARPLSDIRETTEPNLINDTTATNGPQIRPNRPSEDSNEDGNSDYEVPPFSFPRRRSSMQKRNTEARSGSPSDPFAASALRFSKDTDRSIPSRHKSRSPVRFLAAKKSNVSSDMQRKAPSRTVARKKLPMMIVENPNIRDSRIKVDIHVTSPLFVGGGTVEGKVLIDIPHGASSKRKSGNELTLGRISVDVVGVEEVATIRKSIFLSAACELVDNDHPPPASMLRGKHSALTSNSQQYWQLTASKSTLPFKVDLPLNVGSGPFTSKRGRIFYLLCVTLLASEGGKPICVRKSQEIALVSVFDPEKALVSLPSPLTVSDEAVLKRGRNTEKIQLIAGIHRQTWISGTRIYVDVFIANNSHSPVQRITVELERCIIIYKHTTASTLDASGSHLRLSDDIDSKVVSSVIVKAEKHGRWRGVPPQSSDIITCDVPIPRDHVSVRPLNHLEVRYRLNITIKSGSRDSATVQLPATIIHMSSLDILPNSLQSVSTAIETLKGQSVASTSTKNPASMQGKAFVAPRQRSLSQLRRETFTTSEMNELQKELEGSPRKKLSFDIQHPRVHIPSPPMRHMGNHWWEDNPPLKFSDSSVERSKRFNRLPTSTSGLLFDGDDHGDSWYTRGGITAQESIRILEENRKQQPPMEKKIGNFFPHGTEFW